MNLDLSKIKTISNNTKVGDAEAVLMIDFAHGKQAPNIISVYLTSEPNSFGTVWYGRWYDGQVQEVKISRGYGKEVHLTDVKEVHYLDGKCSSTPYYEGLAEMFEATDFSVHNWTHSDYYTNPGTL